MAEKIIHEYWHWAVVPRKPMEIYDEQYGIINHQICDDHGSELTYNSYSALEEHYLKRKHVRKHIANRYRNNGGVRITRMILAGTMTEPRNIEKPLTWRDRLRMFFGRLPYDAIDEEFQREHSSQIG